MFFIDLLKKLSNVKVNICKNLNTNKLMLVTKQLLDFPNGGRELLCKLNYDILKETYGDHLVLFELSRSRLQGLKSIFNAFKGYIDGLNDVVINNGLQVIQAENVKKIFVDGSNLGMFVKAAKKRFPNVEITIFFHNVEARFFLGSLKQKKSLRALGVLIANYLAERKAVRYSDKIICLSNRDSRLLQKLYGRAATHISPMALQDKLPTNIETFIEHVAKPYALFVGGGFYANRAGILWFVRNVVPRIAIKTCIVGRGLGDLKRELEEFGKVEVVGGVDDLAPWYVNAHFVIAPIFDGSGMKTKVAEALMFGKKVLGTPEAFSGYEDIVERAGRICVSAEDFISAIKETELIVKNRYDNELRLIYEVTYSYEAARNRFQNILDA